MGKRSFKNRVTAQQLDKKKQIETELKVAVLLSKKLKNSPWLSRDSVASGSSGLKPLRRRELVVFGHILSAARRRQS